MNNQNTNNQNNPEIENIEQENNTTQAPTQLDEEQKKRLNMLRLKENTGFQSIIKNSSDKEKKDLKDKYNAIYSDTFGDLELSDEEKIELKRLEKIENTNQKKTIKAIRHELVKTPPKENFEGFVSEKETPPNNIPPTITEEMARIMLYQLPEELRAIFTKYFSLRLFSSNWDTRNSPQARENNAMLRESSGGAIVKRYFDNASNRQKYRIIIDKDSLMEERERTLAGVTVKTQFYNIHKLNYIVTRAILATVSNKKDIEDFCKKDNIKKGLDKNLDDKKSPYDDWIAMCFSDKSIVEKREDELLEKSKKWLKQNYKKENFIDFKNKPDTIIIKSRKFNEKLLKERFEKWTDPDTGKEIKGFWKHVLNLSQKLKVPGIGKNVWNFFNSFTFSYNYDRYYTALAEEDNKEVKRIQSLDLTGGDTIKLLKDHRYLGDKDRLRQLILTIALKNAYETWMGKLYLWKYDPIFKRTKGKEISADGFDFITRVTKASQKNSKAIFRADYKKVGNRYIRQTYEQQLAAMDEIYKNLSLRDVQRVAPDVFGNYYDSGEFMDMESKLGDMSGLKTEDKEKKGLFVSSFNGDLSDLVGKKDAKQFVEDMQQYSTALNEKEFLNLVNPGVKAIVRKFKEESTRHPNLFSMYTSPMIKNGFEYYKNQAGRPNFATEEYDKAFKEEEKKFRQNDFNPQEVAENSSYDDIFNIYENFVKEKKENAYTSGSEPTKYSQLLDIIRLSRDKINSSLEGSEDQGSSQIKSYFSSILSRISNQETISVEESDKIRAELQKSLEKLSPEKAVVLTKNLNDFFKHLANLGIVRQYQALFKPYQKHLSQYLQSKDKVNPEKRKEIIGWFYKTLLPQVGISIAEKVKLFNNMYPELTLDKYQINAILQERDLEKQMSLFANAVDSKLSSSSQPGRNKFDSDYEKLNSLFFDVTRSIEYPDDYEVDLHDFTKRFQDLDLIPSHIKQKSSLNIKKLLTYLKLAKAVTDDYNQVYRIQQQKKYERGLLTGYDEDLENELDMEMTEEEES